jgi:serine phosphatase RsbU (regulator of sigma subunit)
VIVAITIVVDVVEIGIAAVRVAAVIEIVAMGLIATYTVAVRQRLGLVGTRGDTMLGELRDRIMSTAEPGELPPGWHLELTTRSAGGTAFGGDFVVTRRDGPQLELVMVDVSGKGVAAGTRALQLSGALGALLGSLPPPQFLAQANRYLFQLSWEEGFATALHVAVQLDTGVYAVAAAGHPPAASFDAGSGRWQLLDAEGPALGLLERPEYGSVTGQLDPGDALLIYTDGLVEVAGQDLAVGIDKLLGEANRLVLGGFAGGTVRLLDAITSRRSDDRAALLLWRS